MSFLTFSRYVIMTSNYMTFDTRTKDAESGKRNLNFTTSQTGIFHYLFSNTVLDHDFSVFAYYILTQ